LPWLGVSGWGLPGPLFGRGLCAAGKERRPVPLGRPAAVAQFRKAPDLVSQGVVVLGCCTVSGMVLGRISRLVLLFTEMLRLASGIDRVTARSYLFIMLSDGGWTGANRCSCCVGGRVRGRSHV